MRNTELEANKCVEGLKAGLIRYKIERDYFVTSMGVYKITEFKRDGITPKDADMVCPIVYLSSLSRSVPQEIKAELIVIDEFIDGQEKNKFCLKNYGGDMKKAVSRLIRPLRDDAEPFILALANPHQPQSDLLQSWGLDFD
jgi:hypothetical protein